MTKTARLKLKRNRAPDEISHGVLCHLVRTQLLNQCAHIDHTPTVKIRERDLLADRRNRDEKRQREADRNFHQTQKCKPTKK